MSRSARRYDLYLPVADNNGRPLADAVFDSVELRLLARFGGLTSQQRDFPLRGIATPAKRTQHQVDAEAGEDSAWRRVLTGRLFLLPE
jgi:hypothetical protein